MIDENKIELTGAIAAVYKETDNGRLYLLVREIGQYLNLVGGGVEEVDCNIEDTIIREMLEEISLQPGNYSLTKIDLQHSFKYGPNKSGREGKEAIFQVFICRLNDGAEVQATSEIDGIVWLGEDEAEKVIGHDDLKPVFHKALTFIQ